MKYFLMLTLAAITLTACTATTPSGPNVAVMPSPNKPFEVFQNDNFLCRDYASRSIGVDPQQNEQQQVVSSAVAGTAIGALAGAALGHGHGDAAAVGAGVGLIAGTSVGMDRAQSGTYRLQDRYDIAYMQCMYARGNQVPGYVYSNQRRYSSPIPPPPPPPGRR